MDSRLNLELGMPQHFQDPRTAPAARVDAAISLAWCQLQSAVSYLQACERLPALDRCHSSFSSDSEGQQGAPQTQAQSLHSHTARVLHLLGEMPHLGFHLLHLHLSCGTMMKLLLDGCVSCLLSAARADS